MSATGNRLLLTAYCLLLTACRLQLTAFASYLPEPDENLPLLVPEPEPE